MTTRTWTGEVSNDASNGDNWSPAGAPQPGDTLTDMLNGQHNRHQRQHPFRRSAHGVIAEGRRLGDALILTDAQVNLTEQPPSKGR